MSQTFPPYVSGRTRAMITIALLALGAMVNLLSIIVTLLFINDLIETGAPNSVYEMGEKLPELLYILLILLHALIFAATGVAFLMWIHRAYRNLPALGAMGMDTTPGWAVGYFFIPIVNFFMPYRTVKEIWHKSAPVNEGVGEFGSSASANAPAIIGCWWLLWIACNIVTQVHSRMFDGAETIGALVNASRIGFVSDVIWLAASVLAIFIIKKIDDMQETTFKLSGQQQPPPPPESFDTYRTA